MFVTMNIDAERAKRLSQASELKLALLGKMIHVIEHVIKNSCDRGDFFTRYRFKNDEEIKLATDIAKILKDNGYETILEVNKEDKAHQFIEDIYIGWNL